MDVLLFAASMANNDVKQVGHVTLPTPLKGQFIVPWTWIVLAAFHLCTKFDVFWWTYPRTEPWNHGKTYVSRFKNSTCLPVVTGDG